MTTASSRGPALRGKALILGSTRSDRDLSASELASLRSHSGQVAPVTIKRRR